jgi:hypothetical protein
VINLKKVGQFFTDKKLWDKPFNAWSKEEMIELAEVFFSSCGDSVPRDGWKKPSIKDGKLFIPFDVHPKYRWWDPRGQSITATLIEIGATKEMIEANRPIGYDEKALKR